MKAAFDQIELLRLGPQRTYLYFPEDTNCAALFREIVSTNYCIFIKIVKAVLEEVTFLCFGPILRAHIFGAIMFTFTGHLPVIDKLLNTQYEWYSYTCLSTSERHIHSYIHMYIEIDRQHTKSHFFWGGLRTYKSVRILDFFLPSQYFLICRLLRRYMTK
jgi:hypothetical protein